MKLLFKIISVILYCTIFLSSIGSAQENYYAGFAKESIEPPIYPFSLALAGYGFPREGRFSLEWINKGTLMNCQAFSANAEYLFAVSGSALMMARVADDLTWKRLGKADQIALIAGSKGKIYAIDFGGDLMSSGFSKRLEWKKMDKTVDAISICVLDDVIFLADKEGKIICADIKAKKLNWRSLTVLPGLKSISVYADCLYALTEKDDLLKFSLKNTNKEWIKIAGYNSFSYDIHLKSISVGNHTLYGLDSTNSIYAGRHLTTGDLSVTALAVSSGKQTVVLLGADLCGLTHDFVSSVKEEVAQKFGILANAVLINTSHTHFAPVVQHWPAWPEFDQKPDSVYMNKVVRSAIIQAIACALKNMVPSELFFGRGKTGIGANRALSGDYIPYDNDVDVLNIVSKKDNKKTVLFLVGCHPVFKNDGAEGYTISPNFPGITRAALNNSADISNSMFIQGCGGDINPVDDNQKNTGKALASDVFAVLNQPMKKLAGGISFYIDSVNFPVKKRTEEQIVSFRKENDNDKEDVYAEKNVRWADYMLHLSKENRMPTSMPVYIQTINIGNWKLVGLSREAVTDYSIGIKKLWPRELVSVAGYCNDVSSYLPTLRHINMAAYEGLDSFYWYAQPSVFPENVYDIILDKIKVENH